MVARGESAVFAFRGTKMAFGMWQREHMSKDGAPPTYSVPGRFCCKNLLASRRASERRTRFLAMARCRRRIPCTSHAAEWNSIRRAFYQTSDRLLQQNRHDSEVFGAAAIASGIGGTTDVCQRCLVG